MSALMNLLNSPRIVGAIEAAPALSRFVNARVIDGIVGAARFRPHPLSTRDDFPSWSSLTDRTWSGRHLPPSSIDQSGLPGWDALEPLFRRTDDTQRLCPKSTCLFPTFAQYLTDGFIRTANDLNPDGSSNPDARKRNTSNHEIDLCPLYGRLPSQMAALRRHDDAERGLLRSQMIGDEEFPEYLYDGDALRSGFAVLDPPLGLSGIEEDIADPDPALQARGRAKKEHLFAMGGDRANSVPQVAMLNTLLLREHNRLARGIAGRNPGWDDDRVFETARNVNIVQFIKIVVEDYIRHIAPVAFPLRADPRVAWRADWNRPNWITTEFSLLYRWHALVPDRIVWDGTAHATGPDYFMDNRPLVARGLAGGFEDMSAQRAGELGPRNTAAALLDVEKASVMQGRFCALQPYNAYRAYIGRPRARRLADISSDAEVQRLLRDAYDDVDRIDFFTGIFCEDRVPNSPLPRTILSFVALDAFSQALTNPLLSPHVYRAPNGGDHPTFSAWGWEQIATCTALGDLVARNVARPGELGVVAMTRDGWQRE